MSNFGPKQAKIAFRKLKIDEIKNSKDRNVSNIKINIWELERQNFATNRSKIDLKITQNSPNQDSKIRNILLLKPKTPSLEPIHRPWNRLSTFNFAGEYIKSETILTFCFIRKYTRFLN